jgi:hypothetical protein
LRHWQDVIAPTDLLRTSESLPASGVGDVQLFEVGIGLAFGEPDESG